MPNFQLTERIAIVTGGSRGLGSAIAEGLAEHGARVVLVQYPRKGIWQLGFVTNEAWSSMQKKSGEKLINVLMPTSPNPTGGMLILIPAGDIIPQDMSYNEGMKYVVSGGVVTPDTDSERLVSFLSIGRKKKSKKGKKKDESKKY